MKDIVESIRELERSKIDVQLKLFSEHMQYQREKDLRLYENTAAANENARLSISKQAEMVNCLPHLSTVLSRSLIMTSGQEPHYIPHSAPMPQSTPRPSYTTAPMKTAMDTSGTIIEIKATAFENGMLTLLQQLEQESTLP